MSGSRTTRRPTRADLAKLHEAITEAARKEHPVSVRGVFYRVVSAGAIEKTHNAYRTVGRQLVKLRRNGTVPYSWITDGTRWITEPVMYDDLYQMMENAQKAYRRALWNDQPDEVMIFTEKDAISGTVKPVTDKWGVPLGVLRGYHSETFAYSVAQTAIARNRTRSGTTFVYQLGDHDPSGIDSWRAFVERVSGFVAADYEHADHIHFERLAVTEAQITEWKLPTRPTKSTDPRAKGFVGRSVEVDAISATRLRQLVEDVITEHIDQRQLKITQSVEQSERTLLARMRAEIATNEEE